MDSRSSYDRPLRYALAIFDLVLIAWLIYYVTTTL